MVLLNIERLQMNLNSTSNKEAFFYEEKQNSKRNFGFISAPIIGAVLLLSGELIGTGIIRISSGIFPSPYWKSINVELLSFLFIFLVIIFWVRVVEKSPWQGLGFTKNNMGKDFLKGFLLGAGMLTLSVLVMMGFGVVKIEGFNFSVTMLKSFSILLICWIIQSGTEEVLSRGWLFSSVAGKNSVGLGIIVSSLFFALMHIGNNNIGVLPILSLLLFAVLTALYMLKTSNIWGVCGIHSAWNCFQGNVFGFSVSGQSVGNSFMPVSTHGHNWLSGGNFGVEGSIVSQIVQIIVILYLIYKLKTENRLPSLF